MAFVRLTEREAAPYGETRTKHVYYNTRGILFVSRDFDNGVEISRVTMIDGSVKKVSETIDTVIRLTKNAEKMW